MNAQNVIMSGTFGQSAEFRWLCSHEYAEFIVWFNYADLSSHVSIGRESLHPL